jgi:hypothetical protein
VSRFLYRAALPVFLADVDRDAVEPILAGELEVQGWGPAPAERTAWRVSLRSLAKVLAEPAFAASEIFVELFMPLTSRRCDVLLTGAAPDGEPHAVLVELKQWTVASAGPYADHVVVAGRVLAHPSLQVRDYAEHLRFFHSAFTDGVTPVIRLSACVWLHDMPQGAALQLLRDPARFGDLPTRWPLFAKPEEHAFAAWLAARLVPGPGAPVADRVAAGRPLPSPKLLDLVVRTIEGTSEWRLLDEQRRVYAAVRHAVQVARDTGERRVIVVRGGPGTGKSVLGLQLLADAARQHWRVAHASGTKAFQTVLQGKTTALADALLKKIHNATTKKALPVADLFTTFADVARVGARSPGVLDLVLCDEAHRLWTVRQSQPPNGRPIPLSELPMVQEVIAAAQVSVFFLDDNQSVRPNEIGRSSHIVDGATAMGIATELIDLDLQFRCAGSESYVRWVDGLFGHVEHVDLDWLRFEAYDLAISPSMSAMDAELRARVAEGHRARIVAGYCWRWSSPDGLGQLVPDVAHPRFGGWSAPWIEKTGRNLKPLDHQYYKWATDDAYYAQVGSIYSAQGFEFDYVGVIWGEDLVWRGDRWVADLSKNKDRVLQRDLRNSREDPVGKLLNVYRVLLTRGMRGTRLFVLDEETREHVAARLELQVGRRVG